MNEQGQPPRPAYDEAQRPDMAERVALPCAVTCRYCGQTYRISRLEEIGTHLLRRCPGCAAQSHENGSKQHR